MKRLAFILLFTTSILVVQGQESNTIDSLFSEIKTAKTDFEKAECYLRLGGQYTLDDNIESKLNAHLIAAKLYDKLPLTRHKIENLIQVAHCYHRQNDFKRSEKLFKKAIRLSQDEDSLDLEYLVTEHYIEAFINLKSPIEGLETVFNLQRKAQQKNRKDLLFKAYEMKNKMYLISGVKHEERKAIADTMLMIAQELNDTLMFQRSYFFLGAATMDEKAIDYYLESIKYLAKDNLFGLSSVYNNISGRYRFAGKLDLALQYADSALVVSQQAGRQEGVAAAYYRMAEAYYFKNEFEKSIEYAKKALAEFKAAGILRRQNNCAQAISAAYEELGDYENALTFHKLDVQLTDSLERMSEKEDVKFVEQRLLYELTQKRDSSAIALNSLKLQWARNKLDKQRMKQYLLYGGIAMIMVVALLLLVGFQRKKKANKVIQEQKQIVEEKNQEITDSIQYAKRIQSAILPPDKIVKEYLQDSFVFYLPKDIVAGDFYWLEHVQNKVLFAAADCTGHGVPGAMVSVVCNNGLNRAVREHGLTDPGKILDKTRQIVIEEFEKSEEDVKDGMDIALCCLEGNTINYAGAHNPLWIVRKNSDEIEEIKADKQPIGKSEQPVPYTTHNVELQQGDTIYVFSDGYADQFGGEKGKKMKSVNFKKLLLSMRNESMEKQHELIKKSFDNWKGELEQLDDVVVIGVRIS